MSNYDYSEEYSDSESEQPQIKIVRRTVTIDESFQFKNPNNQQEFEHILNDLSGCKVLCIHPILGVEAVHGGYPDRFEIVFHYYEEDNMEADVRSFRFEKEGEDMEVMVDDLYIEIDCPHTQPCNGDEIYMGG